MTRLSTVVMAHPSRAAWVEELLGSLDRPATVAWAEDRSEWNTAAAALRLAEPDATHYLILQDDALACRDLCAGTERAVAFAGRRPVSLYCGRVRPAQDEVERKLAHAREAGSSWVAMPGPRWGVAVVIPTAVIPALLARFEGQTTLPEYDTRLATFFREQGVWTWYTVPSLVDHRDGPSLLARHARVPGRRAHEWLGADRSALEVVWTPGPADPPGAGWLEELRRPRGVWFTCWDCGWRATTEARMRGHRIKCAARSGASL